MLSLLSLTAIILSALSGRAIASLSNNDIVQLLGSTSLTGASVVLPKFTASIITNSTFAMISLNTTLPPPKVGWLSLSPGAQMSDADYLIAWPVVTSGSVSWVLSHRSASGEVQPKSFAASSAGQFYTLVPSLSTNSTSSAYSVVTYLRPLSPGASYPSTSSHATMTRARTTFCYASGSSNPGSSSESATLTEHDQAHATTALDLSKVLTVTTASSSSSASNCTNSPSTSTSDIPLTETVAQTTSRDKWLAAHGILGSIAFLFIMPSAILLARYFRHTKWYPYHAALQVLAALMVIATASIGYWKNTASSTHGYFGILALTLVIVQITFGYFAHKTSSPPPSESHAPLFPTLSQKPLLRLVHVGFGWVVSLEGFIVVRLGMAQWAVRTDAANPVPDGVIVVFWILFGGFVGGYLLGWVKEGMGREQRSRNLQYQVSETAWRDTNRNSFRMMERK